VGRRELCLAAADLITWPQALCFTDELTRCEPATFRYRLCAIAGGLSKSGRQWRLHLDKDWPWATYLANAFDRLCAAPWPTEPTPDPHPRQTTWTTT
jgi:hypothetical protein